MPDSLVTDFENGIEGTYFLNEKAILDPSLSYYKHDPIKLIHQFDHEWQIKVNNTLLPNPFPNHYVYRNGLSSYFAEEGVETMYRRVAEVFDKRLTAFFNNPGRQLYL